MCPIEAVALEPSFLRACPTQRDIEILLPPGSTLLVRRIVRALTRQARIQTCFGGKGGDPVIRSASREL